jgi:hypothetical protein
MILIRLKRKMNRQLSRTPVVHACNPNYFGGGDNNSDSWPAWANISFHETPISKIIRVKWPKVWLKP